MAVTLKLPQKVALITGSTRGIGYAIAKTFAEAGAYLVIHSSHKDDVDRVTKEFSKKYKNVYGHCANLTNADEIKDLVEAVVSKFGKIDILVNNAGISTPIANIETLSVSDWHTIIDINLRAPFLLSKHVIPSMKKNDCGAIINIGSEAYVYGSRSTNIAYTASKGGLVSFTRGLAREVEGYNIRVNAISPWHVRTEKVMNFLKSKTDEEKNKFFTEHNKLHKVCFPHDVAYCALFLASHYAEFIHGEIIHINGGAGYL